jgi:hypothetical protein
MGQARNSGRNASLDQKKVRAAGRRQNNPNYPKGDLPISAMKGEKDGTGGAFGRKGHVRRGTKSSAQTKGGGGGGAAFSIPKD